MSLKNKNIVVTGGSRGIGRAISHIFASKGGRVTVVYKSNEEAALATLRSLDGHGHTLQKCDVTNPGEVEELFEKCSAKIGSLDIVINNAGIGYHHPVDKASYEEWQKAWKEVLAANLVGPANVAFQAAQWMIRQGHGKIINVTSRGAFRGEPDQPAYGASKAGLNSLTQSLAHKLASYGIFVGAVAPGFVETDMAYSRLQGASGEIIKAQSPMNRVATPEEVAQAVYLMARANQWMTGGIFDVNGASYFRT